MRILYLAHTPQNSFTSFCYDNKTRFSWVDQTIEEMVKRDNNTIALAVPINNNTIQKKQKENIMLYGLPDPTETGILKKIKYRFTYAIENSQINTYVDEVIKEFNPDIIQIFGTENPFGLIINKQSIPVVIHVQGVLLVWLRKWFSGISEWQQFRYSGLFDLLFLRGILHGYYRFRKRAYREAEIIRDCKYFIGRTNFDRRIVSLLSPNSIYFHGAELIRNEFFVRQWENKLENKIVCVSTLSGPVYKGIEVILDSYILLKKYSHHLFEFKICGVSEKDEIISILRKKFKGRVDISEIRLLGKMNATEIVDQLCSSHIYVHPSYLENSPNSICEAMLLGMPIVATNVGGVPSMLIDDEEGILVQEGEPYAFAGAILEMVGDYDRGKEMGRKARIKALKRHNPTDVINNLLDIYKNIHLLSSQV